MSNQEKDFKYFIDHKDELFKEYPNKYIVIQNEEIIGVYDDQISAYTETTAKNKLGSFIIQKTSPSATETQVFHTRVLKV